MNTGAKKLSSKQLANIVRPVLDAYSVELERTRKSAEARGKRRDWLWDGFISAFATSGGSRHYDEQIKPHRERYRWQAIERLSDPNRRELLRAAVNPRWREKKDGTPWYSAHLEGAFQRFRSAGGPGAILKEYESCKTAPERVSYLTTFRGIGKKYARDIPMGAYDAMFRKHFAIDARLKSILRATGNYTGKYEIDEKYLRDVAHHLKVNCWDLDKTLYTKRDEVLERLGAPISRGSKHATPSGGCMSPRSCKGR